MSEIIADEIPPHVASKMWQLRRWANRLRGRYGVPIYLCGSALRADNPDPRDWDVRITMPDDEFALRFGPVDQWRDEGCTGQWTRTRYRWSDQCVKDTKDFNAWLHLPGDVQIYPESHVAAMYADLPRLRIDTFPDEIDEPTPTPARSEAAGGEEVATVDDWERLARQPWNAHSPLPDALLSACVVIRSLRQQLAAARADGERLDWLEDFVRATVERTYGGDVAFYGSTDGPALYLGSDNEAHRGATVREAIDRARAEAGSGEVGNG